MAARPITELMAPDWAAALADQQDAIHAMGEFLRAELAAGRNYLPAGDKVLQAFTAPNGPFFSGRPTPNGCR